MKKHPSNKKQNYILGILILLVPILLFLLFFQVNFKGSDSSTCYNLDSGWDLTLNGKQYSNVTLSSRQLPICQKGDELILTRQLSKAQEIDQAALYFYSVHSTVEMYLDGEKFYSYGVKEASSGQLIGYGIHLVDAFPDDYAGKTLTVKLHVTENNAFSGIQPLQIVSAYQYTLNYLSDHRLPLTICLFFLFFGLVTMGVVGLVVLNQKPLIDVFWLGLLSVIAGLWLLCNQDLFEFFISNLQAKVYLEHISLYLSALPMLLYFASQVKNEDTPRWLRSYYDALLLVNVVFVVFALVVNGLNIIHLPELLITYHVIFVLSIVYIFLQIFVEFKITGQMNKILAVGFFISLGIVLEELLRYNAAKYMTSFTNHNYVSYISLAMLCMIGALLWSYFNRISRKIYQVAEQKALEKKAYTDELTDCINRHGYNKICTRQEAEQTDFTLISFDLNHLKAVNDQFGHGVGDKLLKLFANCLKETFLLPNMIIRMGGDEFLIYQPFIDEESTKHLLDQLLTHMEEVSEEEVILKLSAAYGIATSKEADNISQVYSLADQRMYSMKKASSIQR